MGVRVKTTERIVMDEIGTYVVQSVRRVPEEQRYDSRLLRNVRGTPWEPNPGDVSTDLPESMLIIPQLPDVDPAPTKTYYSDNRGRNPQCLHPQNGPRKVWLYGGMPSLRSSPRRIANVWAGTYRRMQETV